MTILEYLACGFTNGFGIYECSNSRRLLFRSIYAPVASLIAFFTGGFGIVEIVDNSNLLLVVGGGKRPFMSPKSSVCGRIGGHVQNPQCACNQIRVRF